MKQSKKEDTLAEALHLHMRAFHDIHSVCPKLFPAIVLHRMFKGVSPYLTLYFSARIIGELAGKRRAETLWSWVLITLVLTAALSILTAFFHHLEEKELELLANREDKLFSRKMFSLDYADMDNPHTHELRFRILQAENWNAWGFWKAQNAFSRLVEACIGILSAITLTVSLFTLPVPKANNRFLFLNHPGFLLLLILIIAGIAFLSGFCSGKATSHWSATAKDATFGNRLWFYFFHFASDNSRALDVRIYNQQDIAFYYRKLDHTYTSGGVMDKMAKGPFGIYRGIAASVPAILTGVIYIYTCLKAWAGAFSVGSVTQYVGAVTMLSSNLSSLIEILGLLKSNASYLKDIYELLDIPNSMYQGSLTTEKRSDRNYEVEFKNVSFKYPNTDTWALRNVSVKFQVGRRLAVVGENGSGKTTFIKLLCRLYDPQEGQILLNGIDIRKYNYRDYMDLFSVVFQDFQLLSQPLGANVAGSMNYEESRVRKSLRDAGFEERLKELPNGLDTQLYKEFGEDNDGVEVSGGEAQKIAIARALYKDAPFLILDEPTAALDPIAEAEIYAQLNQIVDDRTAIYISHRLSSCRFCDEIIVFDGGRIVERGSHDLLVNDMHGTYHRLWHAQAKYYTDETSKLI